MPDRFGTEVAGPLLILAPTGRDGAGAAALLGRQEIGCRVCPDLDALCAAIGEDTGAVLVADEALAQVDLSTMALRLAAQPPWSDLPFVVLTQGGAAARRTLVELRLPEALGNVVFLERPLNALVLRSAVRSALRARQRQRRVAAYLGERETQAAALRESEARFRHMADSAPALIWMTDADGHVTFANMHYEHMFGRPAADILGEGWADIVLPEDLERHTAAFFAAFQARAPFRTETRVRDKHGQVRWLLCEGVPRLDVAGRFLGYTGCNVDITEARLAAEEMESRVDARTAELRHAIDALQIEVVERERAEAALRQAQKMEAVGQLTGGIAHDFNNMLQGIGGSLDMMRRRLAQGRAAETGRYLDAALTTVERAAALTHRLLTFARRQALQPKPVETDALVEGVADLIRRTVGPAIAVELRMGDGIWTVLCDPNQLENVLLNLAINARDAMPESGELTISTEDVHLFPRDVAGQEGATPGDYVEIAVSDTGCGMDEATRARAFEPFFTTKPLGQGTGLGLSQTYGFVRQSGGFVRLDSTPGRGTTVRLYLPRHARAQEQHTPTPGLAESAKPGAGETVLLVEDEEGVRAIAAEHLRELGYAVLEAVDGPAALRLLHSGVQMDVLVTDVGLPGGLNGRQVAEAVRARRPGLPVLFITGYAGTALDSPLSPGMEVIGKPFKLDALVDRVRVLLAHPIQDGEGVWFV